MKTEIIADRPSRIFFNEAKFPRATFVLTKSSASFNQGLFNIRAEGVYRGDAFGNELEVLRLRNGQKLPAEFVEQIRRGNSALWRRIDQIDSAYIVGEPQVEFLAVSQKYKQRTTDQNGGVTEIDVPRQDLYRFSLNAVAALPYRFITWTPNIDISVSSAVVRKSFSDSYNDVFRSGTDVGEASGNITRQISFDYLVEESAVTIYMTQKESYDEIVLELLKRFKPQQIPDPETGKEFLNYININNYSFGETTSPDSEIPPKGKTLFVASHTSTYEQIAGDLWRYTFQVNGSWQREGF